MFSFVAYHVLCRDCAIANKQCAKCLKTEGEVEIIPPGPTPEEKLKLDVEMKHLIKSLPERKRRTFLRFMHGKKKAKKNDDEEQEEVTEEPEKKLPKTRDELLNKLESLKCTDDDEFYKGVVDDEDDSDDSWDSEDYLSGDESD